MRLLTRSITFLRAHGEVLRFLSLFILIFGAFYFLFNVVIGSWFDIFRPILELQARAVVTIVNFFGATAWAESDIVYSPAYSIRIARGCDGVEALSFFLAGVLAFPTSGRAKLTGIAIGITLIQVINIVRLALLYYFGLYFPSIFEEVHIYAGQALVILASTAIFIFWLDRFAAGHRQA